MTTVAELRTQQDASFTSDLDEIARDRPPFVLNGVRMNLPVYPFEYRQLVNDQASN